MPLPVLIEQIPSDLRSLDRWAGWRLQDRGEGKRPGKPPVNPRTGGFASSDDPSTFGSFDAAYNYYLDGKADGISFLLDDNQAGLDIDGVLDPQTLQMPQWAEEMLADLGTYAERSPLGDGIHAIVQGKIPRSVQQHPIALFGPGRPLTFTGHRLADFPEEIVRSEEALARLFAFLAPVQEKASGVAVPEFVPAIPLTDDELLDRARQARNGHKFRDLFDWGGWAGHPTQSEADLALCRILAFWCGPSVERVDRLFRQSTLYREEKWNRRWRGKTYGRFTIEKAISKQSVWFGQAYPPGVYGKVSPQRDKTQKNDSLVAGGWGVDPFVSYLSVGTPVLPTGEEIQWTGGLDVDVWASRAVEATHAVSLKNWKGLLFQLARRLHAHPALAGATGDGLVDLADWVIPRWLEASLSALRDVPEEAIRNAFLGGWKRVRTRFGVGQLEQFAVLARERVPNIDQGRRGDNYLALASLCGLLQDAAGRDQQFYLSQRRAAELLDVDRLVIRRNFKALVASGLLRLIERGTRRSGRASIWHWVGTGQEEEMKYISRHTGRPIYTRELAARRLREMQAASTPRTHRYIVPEALWCHVRRKGTKSWQRHRTTRQNTFTAFLWRNEHCYGFEAGGWELKVRVDDLEIEEE